jgi:hypothetical protein
LYSAGSAPEGSATVDEVNVVSSTIDGETILKAIRQPHLF